MPEDARIDAFLASNLAIWNGRLAEAVANAGDMDAARSALVAARKFEEAATDRGAPAMKRWKLHALQMPCQSMKRS
ncbi:MAG: hypothetical protein ABIR98_01745 [Usitatibacter sp.]